MTALPAAFLHAPIAHRALHDITAGRPENALSAMQAAVDAGYGIELDLQLTADGRAMVFHDYDLKRLTGQGGKVRDFSAADLSQITLLHSDGEGIPSFADVLQLVNGRVPLLIELKDQDGAFGGNVGPLEQAAATDLAGYDGPAAVMSFNPHAVAAFGKFAPDIPRGLTTFSRSDPDLKALSDADRTRLIEIGDYTRVGATFISHAATDLSSPHVARLRAAGAPVLCWTIRGPLQERVARRIADNVTFEGYLPEIPVA